MEHTTAPPRIWPALVLGLGTSLVGNLGVGIVAGLAVAAVVVTDPAGRDGLLADLLASKLPVWLLALVMFLGSLPFGLVAVLAARRSPVPFRERLGLVPARVRPLSLALACVFGPAVSQLWGAALSLVIPGSWLSYMEPLMEIIHGASLPAAIALTLAISVTPGVCEELLFRGYVQRRLLERWSPALAIAVTTVLFSLAHLHPVHVLLTLPLSLWLCLVAWRTGSVWPGMVVHTFNNALAMVLSLGFRDASEGSVLAVALSVAIVSGGGLAALELRRPVGGGARLEPSA